MNNEQQQQDPAAVLAHFQQQIQALQQQLQQVQQQAPQAAIPAQQFFKPDKPATFEGTRKESIDSWLFQCAQYFALVPVPDDHRAFFAATFFKDNAALWWRSVITARQNAAGQGQAIQVTWVDFETLVRNQFRPVNADRIARERLAALRQKTSVAAYTHEFRAIVLDLPEMGEADRLFAYIRGLKPQVAALVQVSNPATVAAAAITAENVDAIYWEHRPKTTSVPWTSKSSHTGPAPMEVDALAPLTDQQRDELRKRGACFRCRKPGHVARNCPTNRNPRITTAAITEPENAGKEDSH